MFSYGSTNWQARVGGTRGGSGEAQLVVVGVSLCVLWYSFKACVTKGS